MTMVTSHSVVAATLQVSLPYEKTRRIFDGALGGRWTPSPIVGWYCRTSADQLQEVRVICCPNQQPAQILRAVPPERGGR